MKLVLGSSSIWRSKVLSDAGFNFSTMTADIDEKSIRSDDYELLPLLIARAKAEKIKTQITESSILITSDQVVVCGEQLREKPDSEKQARLYLESYARGLHAQTNTAVVVTNTATGKSVEGIDISRTFFKPFENEKIDEIIKSGKAMNTAGGFLTDDELFKPLIDHIEGDPTGVLGLPLELTKKLIREVEN